MVFGPCGGVRSDGSCEMQPKPCVFPMLVPWPGPPPSSLGAARGSTAPAGSPRPVLATPVPAPLILTDLSVPPRDAAALAATARTLASASDALLVGDHQDRADFPPSELARRIADAGATPWVTLACRDRTRAALERELQALRRDGLATVLCVTGDGRAFDVRTDVRQVFDLDGTRLAALAAGLGLPTAVVETPAAEPVALRPLRLVEKQRAGAGVAVLNHVPSPADVATFLAAARAAGLTIPVLASVAVYTDARSAGVLAALPGLGLDQAAVDAVLSARDPVDAGIRRAVDQARALLAVDGIAGVNLSGLASARDTVFAAEVQAEVAARIRLGLAP